MNGKGDKPRKRFINQETWDKNWTRIFKKKEGVKVKIKTKDENGNNISGEGYIMRRLNTYTYEIWSESLQTVLLLGKAEFKEV